MKHQKICIIGLGYIGLPTAALFANKGYYVNGVDINEKVVTDINSGVINVVEDDLREFIKLAVSSGKLNASKNIQESDIYIICVPTPFHKDSNIPKPNIDHVISATKSISEFIKPGDLIILESTSPVGTTEKVYNLLLKSGIDLKDIYLAYCPERVLPGKIMVELIENDRIVGGITPSSSRKIANFYSSVVSGKIFETDSRTAELCKLAENSYRDLNVAFANELSIICDNQGINIWELRKLANKHPRVNVLEPSVGVGGHCIAVDPWFIISQNLETAKLIRSAREVNNFKTNWVLKKIIEAAEKYFKVNGVKPKISCLGLSFKPDIDDLRESKALEVVENLILEGYEVSAVEPNIISHNKIVILKLNDAIKNSDIICILVKHKEFIQDDNREKLIKSNCIDFCGALI